MTAVPTPAALAELLALLDRFEARRVLVIGDVMLDRYWWGTVERTSPEAPVPVVRKTRGTYAPGGAANVAANIAGLGGDAILVGIVGDDEAGRELRAALGQHRVCSDHLVTSADRPTTVKTRVVAHSQHVVRVDEEVVHAATEREIAALLSPLGPLIEQSDVVVCSDYAKGVLAPAVLEGIIATARSYGRSVLVDPKGVDYRRYDGAAVIAPNLDEATGAGGVVKQAPDAVTRAGQALLERLAVGAVLITQGQAGMTLFERGRPPLAIPARSRLVFDVTGAGDTVMAALALGMAAGAELAVAARLANISAGLAVEHVATTVVRRGDVARAVQTETSSCERV